MSTYTKSWPCVASFASYKGNNAVEPFRLHLGRLVTYDIAFYLYKGHHETHPFDVISLYFMCVISYVPLSSRASDVDVWLSTNYFEIPL